MNRGSTRPFRGVKPCYTMLEWWARGTTHLSKPSECTASRVIPDANSGLWLTQLCGLRVANAPHQCKSRGGDTGTPCSCLAPALVLGMQG